MLSVFAPINNFYFLNIPIGILIMLLEYSFFPSFRLEQKNQCTKKKQKKKLFQILIFYDTVNRLKSKVRFSLFFFFQDEYNLNPGLDEFQWEDEFQGKISKPSTQQQRVPTIAY